MVLQWKKPNISFSDTGIGLWNINLGINGYMFRTNIFWVSDRTQKCTMYN